MNLRVPDLRKGITERKRSEIAAAIRFAEQIVELHKDTMQVPETISKQLGVTPYSVRWVLGASGIGVRYKQTSRHQDKRTAREKADRERQVQIHARKQMQQAAHADRRKFIVEQYKAGVSAQSLAAKLGVSPQRVHQVLKTEGCKARPSHRPRVKNYTCRTCNGEYQLGRKKPGQYASRWFCSKKCSPVFNKSKG